ncbi:MAG: ATP-binding protein [Acidobacteria bacterium]|nr:ATP-binding protein [Acidobacteriota bacterium]
MTKIGDPDYDLPLLMGEETREDNQDHRLRKADLHISFGSQFGYLDLVQEVCDAISRMVGFDEDTRYWICLSIRESVSNAIQHGNKLDENKKVGVRFESFPDRLVILVQDEGEGFNESKVLDPLDPKNLLKPGGRGVFFVRSFMDEVGYEPLPGGGLQMRMEKRLNHKKQGEENDN